MEITYGSQFMAATIFLRMKCGRFKQRRVLLKRGTRFLFSQELDFQGERRRKTGSVRVCCIKSASE